jgi:TPR repeat protein
VKVNLGQYLQFVKGGDEDKKKAKELYEQALKLDPTYSQAHFCLAYCQEVGGFILNLQSELHWIYYSFLLFKVGDGGMIDLNASRLSYENALKYGETEAQRALDRLSASTPRKKRSLTVKLFYRHSFYYFSFSLEIFSFWSFL